MADLFHRRRAKRATAAHDTPHRGGGAQRTSSGTEMSHRGETAGRTPVTEAARPRDDLSTHPDADEMRARYERVLGGHDVAIMDAPVFLIGLFCAVSPWVVHFTATQPPLVVHNVIIGIAIALLGWGFAHTPHRMYGLSWSMCAIGTWLIISPWLVGSHPDRGVIATNAALGGLTILMGLLCAGVAAKARSMHTGAPTDRSMSR